MHKKILIMGLPQAGKTTLAEVLKPLIRAVHFNADAVRKNVNKDLGFTHEDRIEQARRMGWLCDQVTASGHCAIADFICPTPDTRTAFGEAFTVYVDTNKPTPYADTKSMFVPPTAPDYHVKTQDAAFHAGTIAALLLDTNLGFNWRRPTALFLGRYQPFHDGHKALVLEGLERVGQACIAVRDTEGTDEKNPFGFVSIRARIEEAMAEHMSKIAIISLPNITNIFYGRDVGYSIEQIDLPEALQAISATNIRKMMKSGT
jgi:hypothetical protein